MAKPVLLPPIMVDPRIGSSDLYPLLQQRSVPCVLHKMKFGDAAFAGEGPGGIPVAIGVERKKLRDLVHSLMTARLAGHQLPGIIGAYDHSWLVVEGKWRTGAHGALEVYKGHKRWEPIQPRITTAALEGWLLTLSLRGGLHIRITPDDEGTADFLCALHKWWSGKDFEEHGSHLALYQPPDAAILVKPSLVRSVAALLPGVGFEKSKDVDKAFPSVLALACAGATKWQMIPGIGKTLAPRIVQMLQKPKRP